MAFGYRRRRTFRRGRRFTRRRRTFRRARPRRTSGYRPRSFQPISLELKVNELLDSTLAVQPQKNGAGLLLNGVAQGTDYTNRLGRKVMWRSLLIRMEIVAKTPASYNLAAGQMLRILIVLDKQSNGSQPASSDILADGGGGIVTTSLTNLQNRERFVIIVDKMVRFPGQYYDGSRLTTVGGGIPPIVFKFFKKMMLPTVYNGTGATYGNITTNSLWLFMITDYATALATDLAATGSFRMRFTDA